MELFIKYFILINIVTFLMFAVDKWKAKRNHWRIPERVLLGMSFVGGAIGGYIAMRVCHHKTQKKRFSIGVPVMVILHIAAVIYFYM